jgi:hypothetical protein
LANSDLAAVALFFGLAGVLTASSTVADDQKFADDTTLTLPVQPASDEELGNEAGTPPQGTAVVDVGGQLLVDNATPALTPLPELPAGNGSTQFDAGVGAAAISDLSANISNNEFRN